VHWNKAVTQLGHQLMHSTNAGQICDVSSLPASAEAMVVFALQEASQKTIIWVCDGPRSLAVNHSNFLSLTRNSCTESNVLFYPAWELLPGQPFGQDPDISGDRLNVLSTMSRISSPVVIATSIHAIMQMTVARSCLRDNTISISLNDEMEREHVVALLEQSGYKFKPEVIRKGQASVRGGIIDVWPLTEDWPLRLEFYGNCLQSARTFDPADQRSINQVDTVNVTPASEWNLMHRVKGNMESVLSYLPNEAVFVWSDFPAIEERASSLEQIMSESHELFTALNFKELTSRLHKTRTLEVRINTGSETFGFQPIEGSASIPRDAMEPDLVENTRQQLFTHLNEYASAGQHVSLFFDTQGALDRYREAYAKDLGNNHLELTTGTVSEGFMNETLGLTIVSESDLYGQRVDPSGQSRYDPRSGRTRPDPTIRDRIILPADLETGDFVTHVQHGIGKYIGLNNILFDGTQQEVLTIEYADSALLHVPVSQSHLLSRYVGIRSRTVSLHRLGSKRWQNETDAAKESVRDFAASLLEVQASREALEGHAFKSDTQWQHELEAAFPYPETPDQREASTQTKKDMESKKPMDRLICGDVGFGKTEIAIRAAFKAVMDGKQVAVLVPTTVLCQQHYHTFCNRIAAFPVRIEMLSRFCSLGRRLKILQSLREGAIDIVIGTHSLLQEHVDFADLGLIIIDEEQRFGVRHKEKLKQTKRLVDVLTLTATPIPRTLYMSLTGVKDLSTVQTPPQRRLPIETIISANTDEVIRGAILHELNRQGQVFYLYNRVMTIDRIKAKLGRIVPEARVVTAHGQMSPTDLAEVMQKFVHGNYDVLLCTTIIESGLDIPNVNTIIIDRADRFGIADLYQLRGRVGRSTRKAYAYLLLPAHARLDPASRKRVSTMKRYSRLGSGFNLALRDLELRGAGSLLGTQQSGHVAAIGFLLYCQLLKRTVSGLKGQPLPPVVDVVLRLDFISLSPDAAVTNNGAVIPPGYIPTERLRINAYRRIAEATNVADVKNVRKELKDRYGQIPPPVNRLLKLATIRVSAAAMSISSVETRGNKLLLMQNNDYVMQGTRLPRLTGVSVNRKLDEIVRHINQSEIRGQTT